MNGELLAWAAWRRKSTELGSPGSCGARTGFPRPWGVCCEVGCEVGFRRTEDYVVMLLMGRQAVGVHYTRFPWEQWDSNGASMPMGHLLRGWWNVWLVCGWAVGSARGRSWRTHKP